MFYPKIGDHVLLRNNKVAKIVRKNVVFNIEVLPDLRPAICSKGFIVKVLPPVDLGSLRLGDKVRLASGKICEVNGIDRPTDRSWFLLRFPPQNASVNYCRYNRVGRNLTISTSDQSFNIVEIIPQVDLHTLKAGDTVELASGATKEIKSVTYGPSKKNVQIVFTTCKSTLFWNYQRDGAQPYFPMDSIVKILPKPKLDFSMNTVDLTTLKEGDTVHLSDCSTDKVGSIARKMLGTIYVIHLRRFGLNHYCVDGCSLDEDEPSIVRIVDTSTAKERVVPKPKLNLYTLEPGAVVTLANGNTKEVLKVDLQSRAHTNHICITFADGTWIYNPDGTRPPGRDSAYSVVSVVKNIDVSTIKLGDVLTLASGMKIAVVDIVELRDSPSRFTISYANPFPTAFTVDIKGFCKIHPYSIVKITPKPKPTPLTINGHVVKSGDRLRLRNGTVNTVKDVTWNKYDDNWTVEHRGEVIGSLRSFSYYSNGKNPFNSEFDIAAVVNEPTPLTIGGHIVKPGDVLTRANGDRIVVNKITPEPCGNWKVWHSAHGGCFFEVDSSGRCHHSPDLTITAVVPNPVLATVPQGQPGTRMTLERLTQLVEQRPSAFTEIAQLTGRSVTDLLSDLEKGLSVPWPKPITTPPTKKDADPIGQVAVLDKDGDWMQEEWWAARDMLAEGKITGWAHTQAWHDASDPWN